MPDREALIRKIKAGDIFHASAPNGASLVCLATAINDTSVLARRLFVEDYLEFDRTTGVSRTPGGAECPIDSVAPLPPDIRQVLESLDHRNRTTPEDAKFRAAEKHALMFISKYYRDNPI
jgi:hypothetical protein